MDRGHRGRLQQPLDPVAVRLDLCPRDLVQSAPGRLGNQLLISLPQSASLVGGPPGAISEASAGARYFLIVLRSTPNEAASWFFDRPAYQWT